MTGSFDDALLADIIVASRIEYSPGGLAPEALAAIARLLERVAVQQSVETGAGVSTLLFSRLSRSHTVFTLNAGDGIARVRSSPLLNAPAVTFVEGPTQTTLPAHSFDGKLQAVLLDGPHGFPFPQLEYYYLYPHLDTGALLVLDDVQIPTIHQLYKFLRRDEMFEEIEVVGHTAFLRRTAAPAFDPLADGWWRQRFNERMLLRYAWKDRLKKAIPAAWWSSGRDLYGRLMRNRGTKSFVTVSEPRDGDHVGSAGMARGTADISGEDRLWLLARRKSQGGWWPQGGGPVEVEGGRWTERCNFGEPADIGSRFEIAAVVVGAPVSRCLERWVTECGTRGSYPPVALPPDLVTARAQRTVLKTYHK